MADNTIFEIPNEVGLDLTGKSIMVHDLAQPEATSTVLVTFENLKQEVQKETQNGLVVTGGNTELGGELLHPTTIDLNENSLTFLNSPLSGFGYYPFGAREQYVMLDDLNNNLATISTSKDTTVGSETLTSGNSLINLGSGNEVGFFNNYTLSNNSIYTYWQKKSSTGGHIGISITENNGFVINPFGDGGANPYIGTDIFKINLPNTNTVFTIKTSGLINEVLPAYADDAAAGLGGLLNGDRYQTSGAGSAPLNVAGIVMIKQ